jgi:hypothetical protein
MRIYILSLVVSAVFTTACVDEPVASTQQSNLCRLDPDNCLGPGPIPTLREITAHYAATQGGDPTNETWGVCVGNHCAVRIELPGLVIVAVCNINADGSQSCASATCTPGVDCDA